MSRTPTMPIPQSLDEFEVDLATLGALRRERAAKDARTAQAIENLKAELADEVRPLDTRIEALVQRCQAYCEAHRASLTEGGKRKSVAFATGKVSWRITPAKVEIGGTEAAVVQMLIEAGHDSWLRTRPVLHRERMLREPEAAAKLPGITILPPGEGFRIDTPKGAVPPLADPKEAAHAD